MSKSSPVSPQAVTISDLYPDLSPEEQQEAAYWLGRYLAVIRKIFERNEQLTASNEADTLPR